MTIDLNIISSCENCGACCRHMIYPPFWSRWPLGTPENDPEWERLLRERPDLAAEIEADYERRKAAGLDRADYEAPCLWYDAATARCRHYDYRPGVCAEFEVGSEECRDHRRTCGIDSGEIHRCLN